MRGAGGRGGEEVGRVWVLSRNWALKARKKSGEVVFSVFSFSLSFSPSFHTAYRILVT